METLHIELDLEVDEQVAKSYEAASEKLKLKFKKDADLWFKRHLHLSDKNKLTDPWLDFLDNIDDYAVDTGKEDYSLNHEYYLYGGPKR